MVFSCIRSSCDDLLDFRGKKSMEIVVAAFNVSAEKIRGEPFTFGKVTTIFFVGLLSIGFPWGFQHCLLRVQRKLLRVLNGTLSALSSDFEQKVFELLSIKFYHCSQNRIHYVGRINCGKFCFFLEFLQFHIFLTSRETVLAFLAKNYQQVCEKCFLYVCRDFSRVSIFLRSILLVS